MADKTYSNTPHVIALDIDDAVLVLKANGAHELYLPIAEDEAAPIEPHVETLAILAMVLEHPDLMEEARRRFAQVGCDA